MVRFRIALLVLLELLGLGVLHAQSLTPIVSEYNKAHAKGTFAATNLTLVPQVVTVRPYLFTVVDGKTAYREMDPTVAQVRLSETSSKLQPRAVHSYDYDLVCLKAPCSVAFITSFDGPRVTDGIKMEIRIVHSAYVCTDRKADCRHYLRQTVWGLPEGK